MRYAIGGFLIIAGTLLAVSNSVLAERVGASNNVFFKRESFAGTGWTRWNRFVFVLVGGLFVLMGLLLLLGVVDLEGGGSA